MLCISEFCASPYTLEIKKPLMNQFSATCLYRKIVLSKRNLRFARISILRNQIACIPGKHNVIYLSFSI